MATTEPPAPADKREKVKLVNQHGVLIAFVPIPRFKSAMGVLLWQDRVFRLQCAKAIIRWNEASTDTTIYQECSAYYVPENVEQKTA